MAYLIDTDWTIDRLNDLPAARDLFHRLMPEGVALSVITYIELYHGVLKSADPARGKERLGGLTDSAPVLDVTRKVAHRAGEIRHALQSSGKRIHNRALDLIIAATAIEYGMTLVTRNIADYRDIPGIQLYEI